MILWLKFWLRSAGLRWVIISSLCLVLTVSCHRVSFNPTTPTLAASSQSHSVFVHLFEWKWDDIAQECENYLAPHGYGAVQISPAAEHVVLPQKGFPWWQRYQPVSYQLISRSGNRSQLAQMIKRCHQVGIKIYADAVINHMAADPSGIGSAGTRFDRYRYPGLYEPKDFHTCRKNINSYNDRQQVTTCELVGLPDLNTSDPAVQQRIADHLIDLVRLGIDGFRIDAAKHMAAQDIAAILKRVNQAVDPDPYVYQEVLDPGNEAIKKQEYYGNGRVIEAEYGRTVSEKFIGIEGQSIAQLETLGESWGLAPSEKAVVFIDNHDKQRGHAGGGNYLTYKNGRVYDLANVFMLAYPYGTPQVMSSYAFSNSDQGPPADAQGNTTPVYQNGQANCFGEWVCEHRHPAIAAMVGFRNQVVDSPIVHWWSNGSDQIAFGRGSFGFVVINRSAAPLTQTLQTDLPPGNYCNVLANGLALEPGQDCLPEAIVIVNDQKQITVTVEAKNALAIHQQFRVGA